MEIVNGTKHFGFTCSPSDGETLLFERGKNPFQQRDCSTYLMIVIVELGTTTTDDDII